MAVYPFARLEGRPEMGRVIVCMSMVAPRMFLGFAELCTNPGFEQSIQGLARPADLRESRSAMTV
ncbi:hypothetical protein FHR70_003489 [Microvirga lupini]|uniref:Uncharacterized protein n=1 Tax=Microvirga lupini TaxID=420324 RepID=A0A7W4YYV3_9HYPH|nr:hypothetical protein [Microvirga lupini]